MSRKRLYVVCVFATGFGLGAWYGAHRTLARMKAFVGPERWDRMQQKYASGGVAR